MRTRIVVNGREYTTESEMPEEVRQLYRRMIEQLRDADGTGVPDILERGAGAHGATGTAGISIEHSWSIADAREVDGAPDVAELVRRIHEREMGSGVDASTAWLRGLDHASVVLGTGLTTTLVLAAVAVFVGAVTVMTRMDAASRSQGGRLYVAMVAIVIIGALESQAMRLARRRLDLFEPQRYHRLVLGGALAVLSTASLLIGLAIWLP